MTDSDFRVTAELIRRARDGDGDSMQELLSRYGPRVLSRVRAMLGEAQRKNAESVDFMQGVFVEILQGLSSFEPRDDESFLRWAAEIARNKIRDESRRPHSHALHRYAADNADATLPNTPSQQLIHREDGNRLNEALASLGTDHRMVIQYRDFEGMRFAEVGDRMQRTANACKILHARALVKLGAAMENN